MVSLPIKRICTAKKYFRADNHALAYVLVPVNSFGLANFIDIATCIAVSFYSGLLDGPGASYCYSTGFLSISNCIIVESCIYTLQGVISSIKTDNKSKILTKLIKIK